MKKLASSVYIHIPFCDHICAYCDFCKIFYEKEMVLKYLEALEQEIKKRYQGEKLKTIYIGGGTPSSLTISELKVLFKLVDYLQKDQDIEFTMEVNPENITRDKLLLMKEHGVNRISMGVESTNEKHLKFLNRQHDFSLVKEKIKLMKQLGFHNINIDLIYAIPNETMADLKNDLDNLMSLSVNHISTYSLMINEHTKLFIDKVNNISPDLDREMYDFVSDYLTKNGFKHYEISNFCKPGYESRHNLVYWHNETYYGFGLGASGYISEKRYDNTRSFNNYCLGKYCYNEEEVSFDDKISYELILGFRLIDGINKKAFYDKYHVELLDLFNIKQLIQEKKLVDNGSQVMVSYDKIYVENDILINFL